MSSDPILLHIVTDDVDRACLGLFGFARARAPSWVGFVADVAGFRRIAEGSAVLSLWFDEDPVFEMQWRVHRAGRVLDLDYGKHAARIEDWLNRRAKAEQALLAEWLEPGLVPPDAEDIGGAGEVVSPALSTPRPEVMWS